MIETRRLTLVPFEAKYLEAYFRDKRELGRMLDAGVPASFSVFPETLYDNLERLKVDPTLVGWLNWFFIQRDQAIVIGDGGFKGKPDAEGLVEIAYATVPEYRAQGYATEASRSLADWAFSHPDVVAITAVTLPNATEPVKVLQRLGMTSTGESRQGIHWRVSREEYERLQAKAT